MLHDVITLAPLKKKNLHKNHKTSLKTLIFQYFSPQKGALTWTLGIGVWGGDHLGPPKSSKYQTITPKLETY